jgi:hypothetical protein
VCTREEDFSVGYSSWNCSGPNILNPGVLYSWNSEKERIPTHPEIAPGQTYLTPEFYIVGILKKKVYLGGTSILSILLSLEPGCDTRSMSKFLRSRQKTSKQLCVQNLSGCYVTILWSDVLCNKLSPIGPCPSVGAWPPSRRGRPLPLSYTPLAAKNRLGFILL